MATIEANLNDVEAWGGEVTTLPPGEYQVKVKAADVEQKEDGEKIKSQLVVDYEVISGAFSGKVCKAWFGLDFSKEVPRKRLKSLVQAANVPLSPNGSFDSAQLVGCKLNIDSIHQTYTSKPDPITGTTEEKTAVRAVNERPFRDVVAASAGTASVNPSPGLKIGAPGLPGLTKQ